MQFAIHQQMCIPFYPVQKTAKTSRLQTISANNVTTVSVYEYVCIHVLYEK